MHHKHSQWRQYFFLLSLIHSDARHASMQEFIQHVCNTFVVPVVYVFAIHNSIQFFSLFVSYSLDWNFIVCVENARACSIFMVRNREWIRNFKFYNCAFNPWIIEQRLFYGLNSQSVYFLFKKKCLQALSKWLLPPLIGNVLLSQPFFDRKKIQWL